MLPSSLSRLAGECGTGAKEIYVTDRLHRQHISKLNVYIISIYIAPHR